MDYYLKIKREFFHKKERQDFWRIFLNKLTRKKKMKNKQVERKMNLNKPNYLLEISFQEIFRLQTLKEYRIFL